MEGAARVTTTLAPAGTAAKATVVLIQGLPTKA